jgi:hypothetical protein
VLTFLPYSGIGAGLLVVLLVASEIGLHLGLARQQRANDAARSAFGTVQGAILGMLALLFAFTFSMAVGRFDLRRELVLEEANAIGTTWLRAAALPEPEPGAIRDLLRRYVDVRLRPEPGGDERTHVATLAAESERIQAELWQHAATLGRAHPHALPVALFTESLNQVIDAHGKRMTAYYARVPDPVLVLLALFAVVSVAFVGYGSGLAGSRGTFSMVGFAVLVTALSMVILDLDQPRRGMITVSQEPLQSLQAGMAAAPP